MEEEGLSVEEASYETRLAMLDELRDIAVRRRVVQAEEDTTRTSDESKSPWMKRAIQPHDLMILRRLDQDNRKSHKFESRWETLLL